jgi:hypothetical protein
VLAVCARLDRVQVSTLELVVLVGVAGDDAVDLALEALEERVEKG